MMYAKSIFMRRGAFVSALTTALIALPVISPSVAKPDCDVPNPPPICIGEPPTKGPNRNPVGAVDGVISTGDGLRISGWAIDPDTFAPITIQIYVDQKLRAITTANLPRPGFGASHPGYGDAHGFLLTLRGSRMHTAVCATGVNVGPGTSKTVGCGRDPRAISILNLNVQGTETSYINDNGQGKTEIPWRDRHQRIAKWMANTATLPDVITFQEMPHSKLWWFPLPHYDPAGYEALIHVIQKIKGYTGATYRIAYASVDAIPQGINTLYQGRAVLYNAGRLTNTTARVSSVPVVPNGDNMTRGVQWRSSPPCLCPSLDGDGRYLLEAHQNTLKNRWERGASAAFFELKAIPGTQFSVLDVHQHPYDPSNVGIDSDPGSGPGLRTLANAAWTTIRPFPVLIPPIIAGDFNGDPELLLDFETALQSGVDFILIGKSASYPTAYAPAHEGTVYPTYSPQVDHCGTIAILLADHCAVFTQFLPR